MHGALFAKFCIAGGQDCHVANPGCGNIVQRLKHYGLRDEQEGEINWLANLLTGTKTLKSPDIHSAAIDGIGRSGKSEIAEILKNEMRPHGLFTRPDERNAARLEQAAQRMTVCGSGAFVKRCHAYAPNSQSAS